MHIDYHGLYAVDYFGHQEGAASFPEHFPEAFATIIRDVSGDLVLDVGAGNNGLVRQLKEFGLEGLALDLRGDDDRSVLAFDLTCDDPDSRDAVHARIGKRLHVTCCLDVLEHLDRKDLATAIWNLRELASEWLLVSVSTRPSSRYNLYHSLILPKRSWRLILEEAGFQIESHPRLNDLASYREYPDDENCWPVNHWRKVDPFRDARDPESYYLLLRKRPVAVDRLGFDARVAAIVGETASPTSPRARLSEGTHLVFLLGHYQDFLHYMPYWEALPRESFTVLATFDAFHVIGDRREKALTAWMKCRGIRVQKVRSVGEFHWQSLPGKKKALIAASESTASASHMLSQSLVIEARAAGVRTFQIQHGIWPQAAFPQPVQFLSEFVLSWSPEFQEGFRRPSETNLAGGTSQNEFIVAGCAKFDDYAGSPRVALEDLLGDWVAKFTKRVLIATNLHWPLHHQGEAVLPQIIDAATSMPETLFVCKLHPVEELESFLSSQIPPNLLILDEFACLFAGLKTSQLLLASDAVVCTLSTVALEAALAERPFIVLDTGNPTRYEGVTLTPISGMADAIANMLASKHVEEQSHFRDCYFDRSKLGIGLETVLATIQEKLELPPESPLSLPFACLHQFSATFADYIMALEPGRMMALAQDAEATRICNAILSRRLGGEEEARHLLSAALSESQAAAEILRTANSEKDHQLGVMEKSVAEHVRREEELQFWLDQARDELLHLRRYAGLLERSVAAKIRGSLREGRLSRKYPRLSAIFNTLVKV